MPYRGPHRTRTRAQATARARRQGMSQARAAAQLRLGLADEAAVRCYWCLTPVRPRELASHLARCVAEAKQVVLEVTRVVDLLD